MEVVWNSCASWVRPDRRDECDERDGRDECDVGACMQQTVPSSQNVDMLCASWIGTNAT